MGAASFLPAKKVVTMVAATKSKPGPPPMEVRVKGICAPAKVLLVPPRME
jgi:hypothetical protein